MRPNNTHQTSTYRDNRRPTNSCSGCKKEGHFWAIRNSQLPAIIRQTARHERLDNYPKNELYPFFLKDVLEEYRDYLETTNTSINYGNLKEFCNSKGWRFIPNSIEFSLITCPDRIAFLEPKIKQNREAGDRYRMKTAQAVLRGAMTRRWIRKNRAMLLQAKQCAMEKAERVRQYRIKSNLDQKAQQMASKYNSRSSGLNRQQRKVDTTKQPKPKKQNNTFRKKLDDKWTPETYFEFLMSIHEKSNTPKPEIENIYYAVVEKTYGGSTISVLRLNKEASIVDKKVTLNPRMFRDWARGKKTAKGVKVQLESGLLCLIHIDEVIQLFSEREKDLLIEQGIVPQRFAGNAETVKDETVKHFSAQVAEDDSDSEFFEFDSAAKEASDDDSESEDEDEPITVKVSKIQQFIQPTAKEGTSKWFCDQGDSDDSDSESESEEESDTKTAPSKWSALFNDSEDSEDEAPAREKRISRAQRVAQKSESRKAQLAREREARKAATRAKEEEYEREVEAKIAENFDAFLESI
jgi:hypothetical protein